MDQILSGQWRKLIMANYSVPSSILKKYIPHGTKLSLFNGQCYATIAGFMFLDAKIKKLKIPFNHNFEEINFRFYVENADPAAAPQKGVVFIKEIINRPLIGIAARLIGGERYTIHPTRHVYETQKNNLLISYHWKQEEWFRLQVKAENRHYPFSAGSEEEFILRNHYGYTKNSNESTSKFFVEYPEWVIYPIQKYKINVDFGSLYGVEFSFLNQKVPHSVYLAEGSDILMKKVS